MKGWIRLYRNIMKSKTFAKLTAIQKLIAIYIILNANHKDGFWTDKYKGIDVPVKRGQVITSRQKIVEEWFENDKDVTEQKVRTALAKLTKFEFITINSTNWYSLITVLNYEEYQAADEKSDQSLTFDENDNIEKSTSKSTNSDEPVFPVSAGNVGIRTGSNNQHNNQDLTSNQPRPNQDLTTNKNDKNVKEDLKTISRQRKTYAEDSSAYRMAVYLHDKIMGYAEVLGKAHLVRDADMQKWADECRKILELDKRDRSEVFQVINWTTADHFWQGVILSPSNLRKHYKDLCLKMAASASKPKQGKSASDALADKNQREKEKIRELLDHEGSGSTAVVLDHP